MRTASRPRAGAMLPLVTALLFFAVPCVLPAPSLAQTGTISGKVVDEGGNPLSYAGVIVLGKPGMGANTNSEGIYTIHNVPVGTWNVQAMQGGKKKDIQAVSVDANRTSMANFKLLDDAYKMPTIEVVGEKQMAINKTSSTTRQIVTSRDLHSLPIKDYKEAIGLKAGVISQAGELHFRGGRADEVLTIVNGIPSRNPLRAEGVDLGLLAVSSSEQVMGGMDAQYGNALSGIISLTTREGGDKLGGEVRYFTDRYGEQDKSFDNFQRLSVGFGGPFLFPKTSYYLSFEGTYSDTYLKSVAHHKEHRFLDFIRVGNKQSNQTNFSSKLTWKVTPNDKLNFELIRNAQTGSRYHNRWNRNGFVQVVQDSTAPTDGSITTRYGTWAYFQVDSTYVPMNTADHLPVRDEDYSQLALTWRSVLSNGAIYNLRASRQEWKSTEDVLDRQLWEYQQRPNNYYDPLNRVDGAYYVTNGDYPFYERRATSTYTVNGDVSKKIGQHN